MSTSTPSSTPAVASPEIPWAFIDCSIDTLIILISHMLELLIQHNDQVVLTPDALTRFHSRAAPGISVVDYLRRIVKYTNMEKIPLLSLLAYIDVTCQHLPTFTLSSLTVHRFLIAGVCAGSKAQCDVFCTNSHYAKVGGIKVQELNALEREFLKVTEWDLCCNADLLQRYYSSLIRSHGGYTQASEPEASPFMSFPRSQSKPRQSPTEDEEMIGSHSVGPSSENGGGSPIIETSGKGGERSSLDADGSIQDESGGGGQRGRGRSIRRRSSRVKADTAMDVDESPVSAASAAGSSSIPSSAGSSRSRNIGSNIALSFSDPKPAEPRLDTSHAAGEGTSRGLATGRPIAEEEQGGNDSENGYAAGAGVAEGGHRQNGHEHDHHGVQALKHIVGGIFRRKPHPHAHAQEHEPGLAAPTPHSQPAPPSHTIIRSQPVRPQSALPVDATPPPAPHPAHIEPPRATPTEDAGMTLPLTPRVRTREERSVDSLHGQRVSVSKGLDGNKRFQVEKDEYESS